MEALAVWGDFEIHFDGLLGRGGMGSVYRAWQRSVGRWVAVKVLNSHPSVDPELQKGFLQKFQIEIQALARLTDPRIVTILQAGENDGRLWFAMELMDGETVEQRLTDRGAFDEEDAARIGIEVARALDAALRQKIVHRDVKPANIFLLRDGSVKLADFGLARSAELAKTRLTDINAIACTPEYASPEQAEGRPADHRSDLYSLGCVLYEMVTERPPFAGESQIATLYKHSTEPTPSPRVLNPKVSPEYEAVVRRCLEKDPADRFQTYPEMIDALLPPTEPMIPAARSIRPDEAARDWVWPAAAAAGLTLLVIILLAIFTADSPPPAEARTPVNREPLLTPPPVPPAPPVERKEATPKPEPASAPAPVEATPPPKEDVRPDPTRIAAGALAAFRASLPPSAESELIAEVPWGTWKGDLHHAPGGAARFDPAGKNCVLTAHRDGDRVWIKREFAGVKAGYQVRFRWGPGEPRFAVALSFRRWFEIRPGGAALFRVAPDEALERTDQASVEATPSGTLSVVPTPSSLLIFFEDRLLFSVPAAEWADVEGLQLGASGGTILVESVRVKDRTR